VSKTWHDWALQQRDGAPSFSPKPSQQLPQHAARHAWNSRGRLTSDQQRAALLVHAAGAGDLDLLRWLRQRRCPWDERACTSAAAGGHLDVLRWLRSQSPPCPWGGCAVWRSAAGAGQLAVLQWMRS